MEAMVAGAMVAVATAVEVMAGAMVEVMAEAMAPTSTAALTTPAAMRWPLSVHRSRRLQPALRLPELVHPET
jgi:hypothetical protein